MLLSLTEGAVQLHVFVRTRSLCAQSNLSISGRRLRVVFVPGEGGKLPLQIGDRFFETAAGVHDPANPQ